MKKNAKILLCFICALLIAMPLTGLCSAQNVEAAAKQTAKATKAAEKKATKKKYPSNYNKLVDMGQDGQEKQARPALKKKVKFIRKEKSKSIYAQNVSIVFYNLFFCPNQVANIRTFA